VTLRGHVGEVAMLAAIVTTMLFVPAAAMLAGLLYLVGISLHGFTTFNGVLNAWQGTAAWWTIAFLPALAYSVYMLPWKGTQAWPPVK
jgi:ABC-type multidrug transport system permease subunit